RPSWTHATNWACWCGKKPPAGTTSATRPGGTGCCATSPAWCCGTATTPASSPGEPGSTKPKTTSPSTRRPGRSPTNSTAPGPPPARPTARWSPKDRSSPPPFRDPFATTPLVQDVFAFNDYLVPPPGQLPTLREPRTDLPYMVSEAVGVLTGAKAFRRTSPVRVQADQGVLHAAVHDKAMSTPQYMGL